jgi:N-acetyl-beta-hexosaminidase
MNNAFVHEQADHLAVRVAMAYSDMAATLSYAYRLLFGRLPAADEAAWAREFLQQSRQELDKAGVPFDRRNRQAWASLMRVLLSSNEFFYVD